MAYIKASETKAIRQKINERFPKKDGYKFSIRTVNHSTIEISIIEAPYKFEADNIRDGVLLSGWMEHHDSLKDEHKFVQELRELAKGGSYFNKSDLMTDYHNVSHYIRIYLGSREKPFKSTRSEEQRCKDAIVERTGISSDRLVFSIVG